MVWIVSGIQGALQRNGKRISSARMSIAGNVVQWKCA